jgi:hypothetical protein
VTGIASRPPPLARSSIMRTLQTPSPSSS